MKRRFAAGRYRTAFVSVIAVSSSLPALPDEIVDDRNEAAAASSV